MVLPLILANPTSIRVPREDGTPILNIAEHFARTIQGENFVGVPSAFLRLQYCTLACTWCFPKGTSVLMADLSYKSIEEIREGDIVKAYGKEGLQDTKVLASTPTRITETIRVITEDGDIVCTPDHLFPSFKNPTDSHKIRFEYLPAKDLVGSYLKKINRFNTITPPDKAYKIGYLKGVTKGDCNVQLPYRIKLECVDIEMASTYRDYLVDVFNYTTAKVKLVDGSVLKMGSTCRQPYHRVSITKRAIVESLIAPPSPEEMIGFIAGFFDAEGNMSSTLSLAQKDPSILILIQKYLKETYAFETKLTLPKDPEKKGAVALLYLEGGRQTAIQFFNIFNPKIERKKEGAFSLRKFRNTVRVDKIEPAIVQQVYSLQTENGTYIANDFWVKNCDTLSVWKAGNPYSVGEILDLWEEKGVVEDFRKGHHLILTGGSPLKQQDALISLIYAFTHRFGFKPFIEVENECTLLPKPSFYESVDLWNNSPKLANSGMKKAIRYKPEVFEMFKLIEDLNPKSVYYKFVVTNQAEWDEIEEDFLTPGLIKKEQIVLMPEGQTREQLQAHYEFVVDLVCEKGLRMTDRAHISIWDKKTGV